MDDGIGSVDVVSNTVRDSLSIMSATRQSYHLQSVMLTKQRGNLSSLEYGFGGRL